MLKILLHVWLVSLFIALVHVCYVLVTMAVSPCMDYPPCSPQLANRSYLPPWSTGIAL